MTAVAAASRFDMGAVFKRGAGAVGRNLVVYGLLGLMLSAIPQAISEWATAKASVPGSYGFLGLRVVATIAVYVGYYILQGALVFGMVQDLNGRSADFGQCLRSGLSRAVPLFGLAIVSGLAILMGFFLFVIPGIYLALMWMVAGPAIIAERKGVFDSMSRSSRLTEGHRWSLLGLSLIFFVAALLLAILIAIVPGILVAVSGAADLVTPVVSGVSQAVFTVLGAALIASVYVELRSIKEGATPETLAAIFD